MAAADFLDVERATNPDLAERLGAIAELHGSRLWHQLTVALLEFVRDPRSNKGDNLIKLYERFIASFEAKLDQLRLVLIVCAIARQFYPNRPYDASQLDKAIEFLTGFHRRATAGRLGPAANLVLNMELLILRLWKASALLGSPESAALLEGGKDALAAGEAALEALPEGADPAVPAAVHYAALEYYRLRGPAASFYASALQYLGYTPLDALAPAAAHALAVDLALSALVGEGVFNFGEVNAQPILASLAGTPQAWLGGLLAAFQTGSIDGFNAVVAANAAAYAAQPALVAAAPAIKEKITLLALMELAAGRPAESRSIPFAEIAAVTRLPLDQVEWLCMRALSLGLLKGSLDQVDSVFHVTFVKPRVLDRAQIAGLKERLDAWRGKVGEALALMDERTRELLA